MSAAPILPVITGRLTKNKREVVVITLKEFSGRLLADVRVHAATPEGDVPTSKGVSVDVQRLPALREAMVRAEDEARRLGLLPESEETSR